MIYTDKIFEKTIDKLLLCFNNIRIRRKNMSKDNNTTQETSLVIINDLKKMGYHEKINALADSYLRDQNNGTLEEIRVLFEQHPDIFDKNYIKEFNKFLKKIATGNFEEIFKLRQRQFIERADSYIKNIQLESELFLEEKREEQKRKSKKLDEKNTLELEAYKKKEYEKLENDLIKGGVDSSLNVARHVVGATEEFKEIFRELKSRCFDRHKKTEEEYREKYKDRPELLKRALQDDLEDLDMDLEELKVQHKMFKEKLNIRMT